MISIRTTVTSTQVRIIDAAVNQPQTVVVLTREVNEL